MKKDRTMDYATAAFRDYAAGIKAGNAAQRADNRAVARTLEKLNEQGRADIIAAVTAVYFADPAAPIRSKTISARALRFACEYPADISTVYRWLSEARSLFAEQRGLTRK